MQSISSEQFSVWSIGLQQSDRTAYHALFQGMYDPLYRYAWSITKDSDAAYDVLQDVFLKLWQVRSTIDPDRSLKALLYQSGTSSDAPPFSSSWQGRCRGGPQRGRGRLH
ncbi:MAG: sigma factor, partial [Bacteroidota bacterium]